MSATNTIWLSAKEGQEALLQELRARAKAAPQNQDENAGKFSAQASPSLEEFVLVQEVWMI